MKERKKDTQDWNTGFHKGFNRNSTCFAICTKFAVNLRQ